MSHFFALLEGEEATVGVPTHRFPSGLPGLSGGQ
jgi:hypothetical protein